MTQEHRERIARNTLMVTSALIGQKIFSFIYFTMIARVLSVEETGRYFLAISFTVIFSVFIDLGFSHVLIRECAKAPEKTKDYVQNILAVKSILALLTYGALALFLVVSRYPSSIVYPTLFAGLAMILDNIHLSLYAVLRARQSLQYEAGGILGGYAVTFVVGMTLLFLYQSVFMLMIALVLGSSLNVLWAGIVVRRKIGLPFSFHVDPLILRLLWRMAIPFALAGIFVKVYSFIDSILLSFLATDTALGLYSISFKITNALQFVPMAFAAALFPAMSSFTVSSKDLLQKTFTKSFLYLLFIVLPITFGIWLLADTLIVTLYGESYAGSISALRVMIFSLISVFLTFPIGSYLNATNRQTLYTTLMGISMIVNIGVNLFLIPRYGIIGAATASLVSQTFLCIAGMIVVVRSLQLDHDVFLYGIVKAVLSVTAMSTMIIFLKPFLHFLILIPLGAFVYGGSLLLTRAVTRQEIERTLRGFLSKQSL